MTVEFFRAFAYHAKITLHLSLLYGVNAHHQTEALFKAAAHVLKDASAPSGNNRILSCLLYTSNPDMRIPIQYGLTYPDRLESPSEPLDLAQRLNLSFFEPDAETFGAINLAKAALRMGGTAPVILNAANEMCIRDRG